MTNSPSSSPSHSSFAKSSGEGSNPSDELFARQLAEAQADPEWRAKWAPGPRTTITLPWPPASLSGHAKGHWRAKSIVTKQHRGWARLATLAAKPTVPAEGDIRVHVRFTPPDNRGDRTNFANRMKPYFDGIAEALRVNDARFLPTYEFCAPAKPGCVTVHLVAA